MSQESKSNQPAYVILGATGGIGSELARRLHENSSNLTLVARTEETLDELAAELKALRFAVDATDRELVEHAVRQTREHFGRVDGVACCVGSLILKPAHRTSHDEWVETLTANLTSAFVAVQATAHTLGSEGGSVVLVSSCAGQIGIANHEAIAAAKAGVMGLTRSAAATYASKGLRVNCVAPGLVQTPLTGQLLQNQLFRTATEKMHPLGIGEAKSVASAIAWFLDPEQRWVTGQILGVDGGLANLVTNRRTNGKERVA